MNKDEYQESLVKKYYVEGAISQNDLCNLLYEYDNGVGCPLLEVCNAHKCLYCEDRNYFEVK